MHDKFSNRKYDLAIRELTQENSFANASHEYDCLRQPSNSSRSGDQGQVARGLKPVANIHNSMNNERSKSVVAYGDDKIWKSPPIVILANNSTLRHQQQKATAISTKIKSVILSRLAAAKKRQGPTTTSDRSSTTETMNSRRHPPLISRDITKNSQYNSQYEEN